MIMKYSVTSVMLPEYDMEEQAKLLKGLGFDGIELRVRPCTDEMRKEAKPSMWGYHRNDITPENFKDKAAEARKIITDNGLELAGLATSMDCTEIEVFKQVLEGAVIAGAPFIRLTAAKIIWGSFDTFNYKEVIGETIAGYARCLELTKGTGVKILAEMHDGTIHPSASLAYLLLSNFSPNDVGVIYDPQNMVRDGYEDPEIAIQLLGDYLGHCHFGAHRPVPGEKDAHGTVPWKWERCPIGEGLYNFPRAMKALKRANYNHFISIEDFRIGDKEQFTTEGILSADLKYLKELENNLQDYKSI